ncbi:hypothetical protein RA178_20370 [Shewanella oncorhynchi]|uniref:Uncharacterized protein n=1 Tax=Shewanella oncorhynchi TaxID=2726434 RepID=A0AA50KCS1_9GAMM|nr:MULTISPECIES: hypothetical protein [Shewanella]MCU8058418.1 hypothetical protein [Shewanella sp. SM35]MCU8067370.1 hypothetical protein [Shewanella sp. SM34]WMB72733.1 hypothetical protein RA178_20370 [Shewanella oncorhynchi]
MDSSKLERLKRKVFNKGFWKVKLETHRIIQLLSLYGMFLFLPYFQIQINQYDSAENELRNIKNEAVIHDIYYEVKTLTCELLGQEHTTLDCKKGVYQNTKANSMEKIRNTMEEEKKVSELKYYYLYFILASFAIWGTLKEYINEYERNHKEDK